MHTETIYTPIVDPSIGFDPETGATNELRFSAFPSEKSEVLIRIRGTDAVRAAAQAIGARTVEDFARAYVRLDLDEPGLVKRSTVLTAEAVRMILD
jgi:hypothetical protein